jgi:hypothetical protein
MRRLFALLALASPAVFAQTIGTYTLINNGAAALPFSAPYTIVDLGAPATASGTISVVVLRTFSNDCPNAIKVKFFRKSGSNLTLTAERGPFTVSRLLTKVTLSPPVSVQAGDLIGLSTVDPCAKLYGQQNVNTGGALEFNGDVGSTTVSAGQPLSSFNLGAFGAAADGEVRTQVIVAAASAAGVGGSSFKTDIQMANPRETTSAGRLVYHREGTSGTASDVSVPFSLAQDQTRFIADFVGGLGLSGKGSIDVYTTLGFEPPYVNARVYEDSGAGTKGFTFDALPLDRAQQGSEHGILFTPRDLTKFRMNIGVRTLDQPMTIQFGYVNNGSLRALAGHDYPANYYVQTDVTSLLGSAPQPGDAVFVYFTSGAAFVYGSIIDNATQDPSVQLAGAVK